MKRNLKRDLRILLQENLKESSELNTFKLRKTALNRPHYDQKKSVNRALPFEHGGSLEINSTLTVEFKIVH